MEKNKWILISLFLIAVLIWWISKPSNDTTVVYHLEEGFKGCFTVYFNESNGKELEDIDDTLLILVPKDGKVLTSSSYKAAFSDRGLYKEKAFYVDKNGKIISEINVLEFPDPIISGKHFSERYMRTFDPNQEGCY